MISARNAIVFALFFGHLVMPGAAPGGFAQSGGRTQKNKKVLGFGTQNQWSGKSPYAVLNDKAMVITPRMGLRYTTVNTRYSFLDVAACVEVTPANPHSSAGLVFASTADGSDFYTLYVRPVSGDFYVERVTDDQHFKLTNFTKNPAVHDLSDQGGENFLEVTCKNQVCEMYVNRQPVFSFKIVQRESRFIGLSAESDGADGAQVTFTNFHVSSSDSPCR